MAKRLSKARRQAALNHALVYDRAKRNDDSSKMQQGAVKCALARSAVNLSGLHMPRQSDGHVRVLDRKTSLRANPSREWSFDYTTVKGYVK